MNGFDVILVLVLITFAVIGALRGFVREVMSLVNWIVSSLVAWTLAENFAGLFKTWFVQPELRLVAGFLTVFIIVFLIGLAVTYVLHRLAVARRSLKLSNTVLGASFGVARGCVVVLIVFLLAGLTGLPQRPWWRAAFFTPYFERAAYSVVDWLPRDVAQHIRYG